MKVNLSYLKGKKQTWELTSQGAWIEKKYDGRTMPFVSTGGSEHLFLGSSLQDKNDAMRKWFMLSDEEQLADSIGK